MKETILMWAVIVGILCLASHEVMQTLAISDLRAKAVEVGAAEWQVDPKDGTTTFKWKEKKP